MWSYYLVRDCEHNPVPVVVLKRGLNRCFLALITVDYTWVPQLAVWRGEHLY